MEQKKRGVAVTSHKETESGFDPFVYLSSSLTLIDFGIVLDKVHGYHVGRWARDNKRGTEALSGGSIKPRPRPTTKRKREREERVAQLEGETRSNGTFTTPSILPVSHVFVVHCTTGIPRAFTFVIIHVPVPVCSLCWRPGTHVSTVLDYGGGEEFPNIGATLLG
jgi:hypothetical protein